MSTSLLQDCHSIQQLAIALQKDLPIEVIATHVFDYHRIFSESQNGICQHGITCKAIEKKNSPIHLVSQCKSNEIYIQVLIDTVTRELNQYRELSQEVFQTSHNARRQHLENIIRILKIEVDKKDINNRLYSLLAEAYLYRSSLFRLKGFTVPTRKIEAINEAIDLSDKFLSKETDIQTCKIWAFATLELEAIEGSSLLTNKPERLKKLVQDIHRHKSYDINDLWVLTEYCMRHMNQKKLIFPYVQVVLDENENNHEQRNYDLYLYKAKAAYLINEIDIVNATMKKAINLSPEAFSNPFWDMMVEFLRQLKDSEEKGYHWKELTHTAYLKCIQNESRLDNIFLRWYWSRQKHLYDLAFLAAETSNDKMMIADSLKSKTTLRYQAMYDLRHKENVKNILMLEDYARDQRYLKNKPTCDIPKNKKMPSLKDHNLIQTPWVCIHFYLNELHQYEGYNSGFALIYTPFDKSWHLERFDFNPLYLQFLTWQESYYNSDEEDKSHCIYQLCCTIGQTLPFLFDKEIVPEKAKVLFVPHGFLHRLPLHAAIQKETNNVFLETHTTRYLPAWHQVNSLPQNNTNRHCFAVINESDSLFENIIDTLEENDLSMIQNNASSKILMDFLSSNIKTKQPTDHTYGPAFFAILCHGQGNVLNPFKSCLKLTTDVSILNLLSAQKNLKGTTVLLGACESDLAPPIDHCVDEHLSLSTIFLQAGAQEVVAGLWTLENDRVDKLYMEILEDKERKMDMSEKVNMIQKKWVQTWKSENNNQLLLKLAPFRIMGFPSRINTINHEVKQ